MTLDERPLGERTLALKAVLETYPGAARRIVVAANGMLKANRPWEKHA